MWHHDCVREGSLQVESGQPCNWCGAVEMSPHIPWTVSGKHPEELNGDEKEEMYCVGTNMFGNEITGPTIFANGICVGAGENTAYGEM